MVRSVPLPSSMVNCSSFLLFFTFWQSLTCPTLMSSFSKSSKSTVGFSGAATYSAASFSFFVASSLSSCFCMTSSSIFSKSSSGSASWWPALSSSVLPRLVHSHPSMLMSERSLAEEKGRKGSKAMARLATSCREIFSIVSTRFGSVFHTFHGSHSVIYLLPMRARFMHSFCASRNLNASRYCSTFSLTSLNSLMAAMSTSASSPQAGTMPFQYFLVSCRARFTKLP